MNDKPTLQSLFPEQLLTAQEAIEKLDWTTENPPEDETTGDVFCDCGTQVEMSGLLGVDFAYCPNCNKSMQDMTGLMSVGKNIGAVSYIDPDKVEYPTDNKVWLVKGVKHVC